MVVASGPLTTKPLFTAPRNYSYTPTCKMRTQITSTMAGVKKLALPTNTGRTKHNWSTWFWSSSTCGSAPKLRQHCQAPNRIIQTFYASCTLCILSHMSKDLQIWERKNTQEARWEHNQTCTIEKGFIIVFAVLKSVSFDSVSIIVNWTPSRNETHIRYLARTNTSTP